MRQLQNSKHKNSLNAEHMYLSSLLTHFIINAIRLPISSSEDQLRTNNVPTYLRLIDITVMVTSLATPCDFHILHIIDTIQS